MNEINLTEMMQAREQRAAIQKELLAEHGLPLICFTLNIPGPVKVFDGIENAFLTGCGRTERILKAHGLSVATKKTSAKPTGYEAFYCVEGEAKEIKKMMVTLEDQDSLGRLFDLDVLTPAQEKLSREDYGLPARRCMLCGRPAHVCSRSRTHSVEELLCHIRQILDSDQEKTL